ncbi:GNAT family N-acetyltransferase [Halobaculum limi]|uniref:GNAT family N-acetyltransferase n=1 Tax=Halobaculum limi TaxID=3031916 RepID=UPI0024074AC5|nr:N-acetyltransferase [Halobaculum sp. YSMS11]
MTDASAESVTVRPFDSDDAASLWDLKRGFETGLGTGTGGDDKATKYEAKLTDEYRQAWLDWVDRCVDEQAATVSVAAVDAAEDSETAGDSPALAGYVFVLPESLSFIWDAAVLNEVYVRPAYRGTGVADDLMDAALATVRDQSLPLDRMVLDVDRENDRAQSFYDRYGFTHWGEMVARDL